MLLSLQAQPTCTPLLLDAHSVHCNQTRQRTAAGTQHTKPPVPGAAQRSAASLPPSSVCPYFVMSGSGVLPLMGSTLLLSALHAPPAAAAPPAADDGSDVRSLVERALQAWTDEFQLVRTHTSKQRRAAQHNSAQLR